MRWGTKAHQPDVCAIESDQQFFNFLRVSYDTYRAQGRWNWLKSVKAIDLVKFELFRNELANVYESAFSPVGSDFEYEESDTEPPIGAKSPDASLRKPRARRHLSRFIPKNSKEDERTPSAMSEEGQFNRMGRSFHTNVQRHVRLCVWMHRLPVVPDNFSGVHSCQRRYTGRLCSRWVCFGFPALCGGTFQLYI
ncbi:hypothetical protein CKAH01_18666 [Colletotrichum kahawae]|uniref:Uncharacterized protein n=1 Tax=Colletotrichum kahawae TaxID=34407 RepID=A0AAD9Y4M4_COLKA|nr:hypothetical protein CKAH01_18666 [Colletotrichum kahawae]